MPPFTPVVDTVYTFTISRTTAPKEVANLWSLVVVSPNEPEGLKVVDNDTLSNCIAKIGLIFEQDGL